jgi:hypothetical protein
VLIFLTIVAILAAVVTAWMGKYPPEGFSEVSRWTVAAGALVVGMACALLFAAMS